MNESGYVDKNLDESVKQELIDATFNITKIASVGGKWSSEDASEIINEGKPGLERTLLKYGKISETTQQKLDKILTEIADTKAEILDFPKLDRSIGRRAICDKLSAAKHNDPTLNRIRELIEPVTMGEKNWEEFQSEIEPFMNSDQ